MLLLLIWRHVTYYSDENSRQTLASSTGPTTNALAQPQPSLRSSTMRFLVVPDTPSFRRDAGGALSRIIEKLEGLELVRGFL